MANIPLLQQSLGNAGFARFVLQGSDSDVKAATPRTSATGLPRVAGVSPRDPRPAVATQRSARTPVQSAKSPGSTYSIIKAVSGINRAPPTAQPAAPAPAPAAPGLAPGPSFKLPPGSKTTAIVWENRLISDDFKLVNETIDKAITDLGWGGTELWADRFIKADPAGDELLGDKTNVEYARKRLKTCLLYTSPSPRD